MCYSEMSFRDRLEARAKELNYMLDEDRLYRLTDEGELAFIFQGTDKQLMASIIWDDDEDMEELD